MAVQIRLEQLGDESVDSRVLKDGSVAVADLSSTVTARILPTTFDAKGELLVHSGSAPDVLGIGSDDQVLTVDSNETLGVKWATPSGGSFIDSDYFTPTDHSRPWGQSWMILGATSCQSLGSYAYSMPGGSIRIWSSQTFPRGGTLAKIAAYVQTKGSSDPQAKMKFVIYKRISSSNGLPGDLVYESSEYNTDTQYAHIIDSPGLVLDPAVSKYWFGIFTNSNGFGPRRIDTTEIRPEPSLARQGDSPLNSVSLGNGLHKSYTWGDAPNPFPFTGCSILSGAIPVFALTFSA